MSKWNPSLITTEKILYPLILLIVLGGVIASRVDLRFYEGWYAKEDGFVEWLSVLGLFLGSFICFYRVSILKPFREKPFFIGLICLGLMFFFGLGEEISWGQRIIGFKSPAWFLINNTQGETNLHNLKFGDFKINKIIFGTFLGICIAGYFLILPTLYRKKEYIKKRIDKWAIPVPKHFHVIVYILLAILCELIAGGKKGEILEFGGIWIFFLMCLRPFNREIFSRKSFER